MKEKQSLTEMNIISNQIVMNNNNTIKLTSPRGKNLSQSSTTINYAHFNIVSPQNSRILIANDHIISNYLKLEKSFMIRQSLIRRNDCRLVIIPPVNPQNRRVNFGEERLLISDLIRNSEWRPVYHIRCVIPKHMFNNQDINEYLFDIDENDENLTSDIICSICLNGLTKLDKSNNNENNYIDNKFCHLSCSDTHKFHFHCIITWLKQNLTCPCCRTIPKKKSFDNFNK